MKRRRKVQPSSVFLKAQAVSVRIEFHAGTGGGLNGEIPMDA